jgi:hypothetical protein
MNAQPYHTENDETYPHVCGADCRVLWDIRQAEPEEGSHDPAEDATGEGGSPPQEADADTATVPPSRSQGSHGTSFMR